MATYYRYDCGHTALNHPWRQGDDTPMTGLCDACKMARRGEVIAFVRHGKPPLSGRSLNHRDGTGEMGVSVYEVVDGVTQYCGWHFEIMTRPAYLGTGRIVGWGADGEPLVEILTLHQVKTTQQAIKDILERLNGR